MELSGKHFTYNGTSSKEYGLVFAHADTKSVTSLLGEVNAITLYNKHDKKNYFIGESFADSALRFDAEVVVIDDEVIDPFIRRQIEKWLFHQQGYRKLYIDFDCDDFGDTIEQINYEQKRVYLNCRFVNPEKIEGNGGIVGYKFTVECDSSMAWQEEVVYEFNFDSSVSRTIKILTDTDTNDYIYPKVTIRMGTSGGDMRILNLTDDPTRGTTFVDLTQNITFTMNGNGINYISGGNYMKFVNRNFIRLLDGENQLSITGDVAYIKFEFQNQRYL